MKAVVCSSYGPPENLKLEEIDDPVYGNDEALVEVYASALNFPDGLQIQGKYQFQPPMPFTPGSEVAGKIKKTGAKLQGYNVGDRVMATPGIGGLAELVAVKSDGLRKIPDNMNFKTAASFAMVYTTSYYALKQRANLKSGETLLVLGSSGGVGLTAVELGKLFGAKVIAAEGEQQAARKLTEAAKEMGAEPMALQLRYLQTMLEVSNERASTLILPLPI